MTIIEKRCPQNLQPRKLERKNRQTNRRLASHRLLVFLALLAAASVWPLAAVARASATGQTTQARPPLKVLFITGGVYHDYKKLPRLLTSKISQMDNVKFDVVTGLDVLKNAKFADDYDVIVYDLCYDDIDPVALDNALHTGRAGKPTVFIHCAVHSFRNSPQIHEWENYVGLRSKVHDKFGPFSVEKVGPPNPITVGFPSDWKTSGDELYQTIEVIPGTEPLLTAKSPRDGRVHTIGWTHTYGQARVFATTLGHDTKTAKSPAYQRLLANGLLWTCDKLDPDGKPKPGYAGKK
ncbi:MAG: ThuA domain-containing protein [Candidatus Acidiferrales bacterium]